MARWSAFSDAFLLAIRNWRLWVLQFLGNLLIFLAIVWWLRLPDAHWWQLAFGLVLIVVAVAAGLILHGGTLNYFEEAHRAPGAGVPSALRNAFRHLPALVLWAIVFFIFEWLVGKLDQYSITFPGYLRSEFPAWLRRLISEPALDNFFTGLIWLVRWVVLPALLLPFAVSCVGKGFRGFITFGDWARAIRSIGYWITLIVAAVLGVVCVGAIMGWRLDPKTATLPGEETSLVFRLLFAYLLGIFSWLLAGSMLGRKMAPGSWQSGTQPL